MHQGPTVRVKVEHGKVLNSEVGFVNKATDPDYRVFIGDMDMEVENLSNRLEEGTGIVKITGKFLGSGPMEWNAAFRPEKPRPDFDLSVKIVRTKVESFNNILRAYGDLDTQHGMFAFFSELKVKDNQIRGYVKPLLKDVEVYDPSRTRISHWRKKSTKRWSAACWACWRTSRARRRRPSPTCPVLSRIRTPIPGRCRQSVQNAFFKAILPGFERVR